MRKIDFFSLHILFLIISTNPVLLNTTSGAVFSLLVVVSAVRTKESCCAHIEDMFLMVRESDKQ